MATETLAQWKETSGMILAGDIRPHQKEILNSPFPIILTHWTPELPELCQVDIDPVATGELAAEHLMASGYHRLAAVSSSTDYIPSVRGETFTERCREGGRICETFVIQNLFTKVPEEALFAELLDWLRNGDLPAAVFCTNDQTGRRLLRILRETSLHVPDDVAVLGCEDNIGQCEASSPTLSSIHLPFQQVGFETARLLDAQLTGKKIKNRQKLLPPERITERMSTTLFATPDPHVRRAVEFIRRHACENATVHETAQHAGLAINTLRSRFRAEVGHGPSEEFQRVRLEKAKELLRQTDLPLEEIAEMAGYHSGHYLSKIFKLKTGQTARKYRNTFSR